MTDELEPQHLELLKRYDAELQEIELLPPVAIELTAGQALALVTHLQIAAANPAVEHNPLLPSAIAAAKQIQSSFNPESAIYEVLELGWQEQEESCVSHKISTSIKKRQQRLRRPPPYCPDDIPYHF